MDYSTLTGKDLDSLKGSGTQPQKKKHSWRITFNSPVVLSMAAISVLATVLGYVTNDVSTKLLFCTYGFSLVDPLGYVRMFTHIFGHSGWEHLVGNMAYILLLGPILEEKYGSRTLIEIIAITAFACALVNNIFFPRQALLGASGVVFAFILLSSVTSIRSGEIPLTFILVALIFLGQQLYEGIFVADNISQLSHIIGGIIGASAGFLLAKPVKEL